MPKSGWQPEFFKTIGLEQLIHNDYSQLGAANMNVLTAGMPVGDGLSKRAAEEFGLLEGTPVGSGLIDAYAGWLGTVAASSKTREGKVTSELPGFEESGHRLAAVAGTSTCHIVQSPQDVFVDGVWGPYKVSLLHPSRCLADAHLGPSVPWLVDERGRTVVHGTGEMSKCLLAIRY